MSTYFPKGEIARKWYVMDASGQTLGRLATRVAAFCRAKITPVIRHSSILAIMWS